MTAPLVSVIVCTRDRPGPLRRMLESACGLAPPPGTGWELIVVDNGSGEGAPATVAGFQGRLPIRLVREPQPGLCRARNRGLDTALGRYVCWTDDDVVVGRDWLNAYVAAFERHPQAALFGGRIVPEAEPAPATHWFEPRMRRWPLSGACAYRDLGDEEVPLAPSSDRLPWGANFALRIEALGGTRFDPAVGRLGDETDLACRLLAAGREGWWVPDSVVTHMIPAERQSREYLLDYYRHAGHAAAFFEARGGGRNPMTPGGRPAWVAAGTGALRGVAAASAAVSAAAWAVGRRDLALRFLARRGYCEGLLAHRREAQA